MKGLNIQWLFIASVVLQVACNDVNPPRDKTVSGSIETDETRVASRYGGRVQAVLAAEGQGLSPGDPIILLEAGELSARRENLSAMLAELRAGARKEEIQAAKNDHDALMAEHSFALVESKRLQDLFTQNAVAQTDRDRAVSRATALEKNVAAAQSRYELLLAGTRPERMQQAEAQLRELDTQLKELTVTAPTNAVLETLHVKIGDVLAPYRDVATLLLTNHLWVRVYVPEPWLGHIKLGDPAQVRVDAFPQKTYSGTVEQIARAAEFTPRNVQTVEERVRQVFGVKIRLPTEEAGLRPGMAADVVFPALKPPRQ